MNTLNKNKDLLLNVSVCICTRNRPDDLTKALKSVERSTYPAFETIVSDDSTDERTKELVAALFPNIKFVEGPRRGLGANRNKALSAVAGSHVLFIDDDVILTENFLEMMHARWLKCAESEEIDNVILSGIENVNGRLLYPGDQTFIGWQSVEYKQGDTIKSVVINSAIFPVSVFKKVLFDERLVYGNDEIDLTTRAITKGYKIVLFPEAINFHYPSEINRDYYKPYHDASRIYVTFKRYFATENNKGKALFYLPYALLHVAAFRLRYYGISGFLDTFRYTFPKSFGFITDFLFAKDTADIHRS